METFFTLLEERVVASASLLCVGLDPDPKYSLTAEAARKSCIQLVQQTARYAAAFKPNAAFFEIHGAEGWNALKAVVHTVAEESHRLGSTIPIIVDAKRGDIASTASAYAEAVFSGLGAHCITVNPYLGGDSVEPFLKDRTRGVFLLCKTSNPGSADLQDLLVSGVPPEPLYLHVARLAKQWNVHNNLGLVVGATQPLALARIREEAPDLWFLSPGIGSQGGDLQAALQAGLRKDGRGMLINASRSIAAAEHPEKAAVELRDAITRIQQTCR